MRRSALAATSLLTAACAAACTTAPVARTTTTTTSPSATAAAGPAGNAVVLGDREREVLDVVRRLFDAMRAGDSAAMRGLFEPTARLASVGMRQGALAVSEDSIGMFLRAIGTPHTQVYDERIANERVLVDGPYAIAWADYTFYLGDQKNHCGIDAFQLVRRPAGWRILAITDTRRREDCPDLPKG
jgi:hypothetical protein